MTHQHSAADLRLKIFDLENAATDARARLDAAALAHRAALRAAITSADPLDGNTSATTEAALNEATEDARRAQASLDVAGQLLSETITREAAEARTAARADIENRIAELMAIADAADSAFATAISLIRQLHSKETDAHRAVRAATGEQPWIAPQALSAASNVAADLRTLANGITPRPRFWARDVASSSAHTLRISVQ